MASFKESTPKEEQKLEMVDTLDYELNGEKDIFQVKVVQNEKNKIIVHISKTTEITDIFYENDFTFKDMLKLDKAFRIFDKLDDIFKNLLI